MDIRKPKAIHDWREFLKEFATIVLGVSVALAAEQGVEWWHWRGQVQAAREVLATELTTNIGAGVERVVYFQCLEQRMDRAGEILDAAGQSGVLPPVPYMRGAPFRVWPTGAWNSVVSSQVASHFPREQLAALGVVYQQIQMANDANKAEFALWGNLYGMAGPGRRFDPALDSALHAALAQAQAFNFDLAIMGGQIARRAEALDLPYTGADRKRMTRFMAYARKCVPGSGVVPKHYGAMPAPAYRDVIRDWQKYPPYTDKVP